MHGPSLQSVEELMTLGILKTFIWINPSLIETTFGPQCGDFHLLG